MDLVVKNNKSLKGTEEIAGYEIKQIGKNKLLFNFRKDCTFKHGDKLTNLIKARMLQDYEKKECIAPDTAKYICFEIPTYITVTELADNNIFDILNQIGKFENLMSDNYNNLGLIDKIDDKYELFKPTGEVLAYTRDTLDKEIGQSDKMFSERCKQQEFRKRLINFASEYIETNKRVKEKRKEEPFLEEQLRYKIGNTVYTNYKGIDTKEGKILNINRLGKIEETENNILYSAFIQKKDNDNRIELKTLQDLPSGFPIMFTSQLEISEYTKDGNERKMKKLLDLLSNVPEEQLTLKEMSFIGGIDEEGRITKTSENCCTKIKEKITLEKDKYKKKIAKENDTKKEDKEMNEK